MTPTIEEARAVLREAGFRDFDRPWIFEAAEAIAKDPTDYEADFVGWEKWMTKKVEAAGWDISDLAEFWDSASTLTKVHLYSICCDAAGGLK